jgi:leader peptidase (prepilin peptidase)/N-methyltransferase
MDPFVVFVCATFGLLIGSFLNVVIARLPEEDPERRSIRGRSRCPNCDAPVRSFDNIPLISWLVLRGKCRDCKWPIPARYPLVEALTASLWALVAAAATDVPTLVAGLVLMTVLVPVTFIDLDHKIIPNAITYPGVVVGLAISIGLGPTDRFLSQDWWWAEALLASFGAAFFLLVAALIRPGGMGMGDVKLAAVMGAFLGAPVAIAMFAGFVFALIPSIVLFFRHGAKARKMGIPFGPFLAAGTVFGWFFGAQLLDAYLDTFAA